ncbi:MAG: bifunctional phosphoribosylaminoimidazolecarboxamide formyltransferase/IMP cyclohydrolase [Bacillota bacterium]|nr:bifunctional phosphoribosylaminoimidazolecarboxamide formyltransferase/IMP cyclohydrolase [Bacillota bacterium]MDI7249018.1 bifunctional phosphoribosylaminoimidazolecarboxamide formyltransferase/IMP cyclohydrolase [Bacillota bacterium]
MAEQHWAVVSVWDKNGVAAFARGLVDLGLGVMASGGTADHLARAGIPVTRVEKLTGFGTLLEGRVKTLHPLVHAGILARRDRDSDMAQLRDLGAPVIDLVAVNLYPFGESVARGARLAEALEMIDIGGPALLRAAAKNFPHVWAICRPERYGEVLDALRRRAAGELAADEEGRLRRTLAAEAFRHTMAYDYLVSRYLEAGAEEGFPGQLHLGCEEGFPGQLHLGWELVRSLRYGENPHQKAALYRPREAPALGLAGARQVQGKELSYNNLADASAAWALVREFEDGLPAETGGRAVAVVVKHAMPCAVALGPDAATAFRRAREGDPVSVFGGIVALNVPVDEAAAAEMARIFLEVVVAPGFTAEALWHLGRRPNVRLLEVDLARPPHREGVARWHLRQIDGGLLVQEWDRGAEGDDPAAWRTVTVRRPTSREVADLAFAWKVVKHVRSNAVVLVRDEATVGVGPGQPNRVDAARLAISRAGGHARGAVMASDGFFPFPDVVEEAVRAGVTAIVQPGGSVRDDESIAACDRAGLAMMFTGVRHFLH